MVSGIGALLMADTRNIAEFSARVSPMELIKKLNRVTTTMIAAVQKRGGIVHLHVGGSFLAYWPPEKMPGAACDAITAASEAIAAHGESVAVSVAVAELAVAKMGAGSRLMLVGAAYQRAETTLRISPAGKVTVDPETLRALPAEIGGRFVLHDGYAELQLKERPNK